MVTAGTKNKNIQGSSSSMGRSDATRNRYAWRKNMKSLIAMKTTSKM